MTHILRSRAITVSVKQKTEQKTDSPKSNHLQVEQQAKPLRLVYCDEDGTFRMDAEAVATLQLVKGPLGVVSVCGRARQGKSFILNQLLGRSSGFQVAATHRPCTKGLWMWSTPLKRMAPDGTEYSLVLLDSEGIDAYDQTGTYSTQIFSLAVLLSSMFVYNQMGGIDEAALDRLSLVTEMTKHIRVRTSDHRPSAAELGQFSPIFLWLLRDFYLDLTEDGRRISPRDYLEGALQPLSGVGKAIASRNEIRDSIRALFPDRDCFTLVRPLNDERDLQRLDQIPLDRLRPEFRAGLDALTKFIFERTKPKQLGSIIMTGPLLASLTQSFLDAINAGAVPTIATSWQNVEESECRRAHDSATEDYIRIVNDSEPTDEEKFREIHESAVEDALRTYNSEAVGAGAARQKYEKLLLATVKRLFEENMHKLGMEAEMRCVKAVESMDEKLWEVCQSSSATFDEALEMLNSLVIDYEHMTHGPAKWKKLAKFLQNSLEGPLSDMTKRLKSQSVAENSVLQLKCQSLEERLANTIKQLEASKRDEQDWKKRYESAVADSKASEDAAAARYAALQKMHNALEAKFTALSLELEDHGKETSDWRSKYEHLLSDENAVEKRMSLEIEALQSRCSAAEGRLAATREQLESAKEEAAEWKRKHDSMIEECRTTSEKYSAICERISAQAVSRQDALREELSTTIALKEKELKDSESKLDEDERNLAALQTKLEDQILKCDVQEQELTVLRSELKQAKALADAAKAAALSSERELKVFKQECSHLEERVNAETKRLEEVEAKYKSAQQEAKLAIERAEKAHDEASQAEKDKLESNRLAVERLAAQERSDRRAETLAREKEELLEDLKRLRSLEEDAEMRIKSIDRQLEDREREMEELLDAAHKQRANTIQVLETLLASERRACADANARAEALSLQLQATQSQLDALQCKFSTTRLNETVLDSKLRTCQGHQTSGRATPPGKRLRDDNSEPLQEAEVDAVDGALKKRACIQTDDMDRNSTDGGEDNGDNSRKPDSNSTNSEAKEDDYLKFTVPKLKQELTNAGFAEELLQLRSAAKKDIISLYERLILHK